MAGWRSKADERRDAWLDENVPPDLHVLVRAGGAYLAALRLLHAARAARSAFGKKLLALDAIDRELAAELLARNDYLVDPSLIPRLERLVLRSALTLQAEQVRRRAERANP